MKKQEEDELVAFMKKTGEVISDPKVSLKEMKATSCVFRYEQRVALRLHAFFLQFSFVVFASIFDPTSYL